MDTSWIVAVCISVTWILAVLLQLGDLGTSAIDEGTARDRETWGRISRERAKGLYWVLPLVSVVAVGLGVGVDFIARLLFDLREPMFALFFALVLVAAVAGAGLVIVVGLVLEGSGGYRELRAQVRALDGRRVTRDELGALRGWLAAIDAKLPRVHHDGPVTIAAALRYLFRAGYLRLLPILLGLAVTVSVIIAAADEPRWSWLIVAACLAPVLSGGLALAGAHAHLTAESAWRLVHRMQRADIVNGIEELERRAGKRTVGLAERVGRALQILREQQGQ